MAERDDPLHELFADALDLANPELWKSNSLARLRDRLIINVRAAIAKLESDYTNYKEVDRNKRLHRAREILELLLPQGSTR